MTKQELGISAFHIHTRSSDGIKTPEECLDLAEQTKVDTMVITDHDDLSGAFKTLEAAKKCGSGMSVVPATEVSTAQGHLIAAFVKENIPIFRSLEETVKAIHGQGGLAIIPHFAWFPFLSVSRKTVDDLYQKGGEIDGVEVMTPFYCLGQAEQALKLSREYNMAQIGADDDHLGNLGRIFITLFPGETADDLREAIQRRQTLAVRSELPLLWVPYRQRVFQAARGYGIEILKKALEAPSLVSTFVDLRRERSAMQKIKT